MELGLCECLIQRQEQAGLALQNTNLRFNVFSPNGDPTIWSGYGVHETHPTVAT